MPMPCRDGLGIGCMLIKAPWLHGPWYCYAADCSLIATAAYNGGAGEQLDIALRPAPPERAGQIIFIILNGF